MTTRSATKPSLKSFFEDALAKSQVNSNNESNAEVKQALGEQNGEKEDEVISVDKDVSNNAGKIIVVVNEPVSVPMKAPPANFKRLHRNKENGEKKNRANVREGTPRHGHGGLPPNFTGTPRPLQPDATVKHTGTPRPQQTDNKTKSFPVNFTHTPRPDQTDNTNASKKNSSKKLHCLDGYDTSTIPVPLKNAQKDAKYALHISEFEKTGTSADWEQVAKVMMIVRSMSFHHTEYLTTVFINDVMPCIQSGVDSLRSCLCLTAMQCMSDLVLHLKRRMSPYADKIVQVLSKRAALSNDFIKQKALILLNTVIFHLPLNTSMQALCRLALVPSQNKHIRLIAAQSIATGLKSREGEINDKDSNLTIKSNSAGLLALTVLLLSADAMTGTRQQASSILQLMFEGIQMDHTTINEGLRIHRVAYTKQKQFEKLVHVHGQQQAVQNVNMTTFYCTLMPNTPNAYRSTSRLSTPRSTPRTSTKRKDNVNVMVITDNSIVDTNTNYNDDDTEDEEEDVVLPISCDLQRMSPSIRKSTGSDNDSLGLLGSSRDTSPNAMHSNTSISMSPQDDTDGDNNSSANTNTDISSNVNSNASPQYDMNVDSNININTSSNANANAMILFSPLQLTNDNNTANANAIANTAANTSNVVCNVFDAAEKENVTHHVTLQKYVDRTVLKKELGQRLLVLSNTINSINNSNTNQNHMSKLMKEQSMMTQQLKRYSQAINGDATA